MKKLITRNKGIFSNVATKSLRLINENKSIKNYTFSYIENYENFNLKETLDKINSLVLTLKKATSSENKLDLEELETVTIKSHAANNVQKYNTDLEKVKTLLDNGELIEPRKKLPHIIEQLEIRKSVLEMLNDNGDLVKAYNELLAKSYTYEGIAYGIGTKGEDIALIKFNKAIELLPDYDLPQKKKEAILFSRGILPNGKTLVFEDGSEIKTIK